MRKDKLELAYQKVMNYMFDNNFTSFDPYDGLNTNLRFPKKSKFSRLVLIYFNKFSPLNIRKFLKIQKSRQLMTLCTIANAIFIFNKPNDRELEFINQIYEELKKTSLKPIYGYHCWDARNFPIQMQDKFTDVNIPGAVGNEIVGTFLINYYRATGNNEALNFITNLADLFIDKYFCLRDGFSFFRYKINDTDDKVTLNASLKAMAYLIQVSKIKESQAYDDIIIKVMDTVLKLQKEDGRWNYTYFIDKQIEKKQVDFHQGFILDDLLLFMNKYGYETPYRESYQKGINFYHKKQFMPDGRSVYRYPRKWPIDIHNQAQGIITFTRASKAGFGNHYFKFACTIAEWTINNMQDKDGHFHFMKYPFITNKIPYIRWSDANMAYALSILLTAQKDMFVRSYA